MSARPAPRKSSLAGSSPVTPPAALPTQRPAPEPAAEVPVPAEPPAGPTPAAAKDTARPKPKYPPKVSFYQDREDTERMRAAFLHTFVAEGSRSLSDFIHNLVMAEVVRLERKYNHGEPFPPVKAGQVPQGRPMGE